MNPKPLSDAVKRGFAYLISQQHTSGGWGQGGGWRTNTQGGWVEGPEVQDPPDVANTCVATLAIIRGRPGSPDGRYYSAFLRGITFVIGQVEQADNDSPYVTDLRGTQVQTKIGPYVDTFLASLVLAETKGRMRDRSSEGRLSAALDKVIGKMQRHQQKDGTWAMDGWAPAVGQSLAAAGLSRASQRGAKVSNETLKRAERYAQSQYDPGSQSFSGAGSAEIPLYATASHLSSSSHTLHSFEAAKTTYRRVADSEASSPEERAKAEEWLKYFHEAEAAHEESLSSSYAFFRDPGFIQGFGSNGGEEFLSYLNISETLLLKGGQEWDDWDQSMTKNLERIQNNDGSWTGHHCITGRTFCTASALLVLVADRAPRPKAATV